MKSIKIMVKKEILGCRRRYTVPGLVEIGPDKIVMGLYKKVVLYKKEKRPTLE